MSQWLPKCASCLSPQSSALCFAPFCSPAWPCPSQIEAALSPCWGGWKGCPIRTTKNIKDRGPQLAAPTAGMQWATSQLHPLTAPCLWIPFPGSPVSGQTGLGPETIVPMFCISWKANHSMEKLKITAQANTKILLEQQRKTRGCLAVCKKLRCYEDCSPVLWKEKWLPLSLLAASCKWSSGLSLLTEWIHCHKHEPRAYPRTWWGCHAPWRWITAVFQHRLYPAQPAFPLTHPSHAGNLVDVSACQQVW